ncbi:MAG: NfeD family protein [Cucumibacter sp.]
MDLIALISAYGGWSWVAGGAVLLAIELVVPGGVFVWLGISAITAGLATLVFGIPWQWQWAIFAVLSIVSVVGWTMLVRRRPATTESPFLNRRTGRFVGQVHTLGEPIANGEGRLRIGDTTWRVRGPDAPAGARVKIVGAEASILEVEPAPAE